MLDLLDLLLLKRGVPVDDQTLTFRRMDGDPQSKVIYFLPWHTPLRFARQAGIVSLDFLAAYEMPPAIVSSDPRRCVEAAQALVADAERILALRGVIPRDALIVGLSVGTYVAAILANRLEARLCAVAGADRADLMLWESPAARIVKRRAIKKGYGLAHYADAMAGQHPVDNLARIAPDSCFVVGTRDPFVPPRRREALLAAIEALQPRATIVRLDAGHLGTLVSSKRAQREFAGIREQPNWRQRLPIGINLRARAPADA